MKIIDDLLNKITMYRLFLYYLIGLLVVGSFIQNPVPLLLSTAFLVLVGWGTNRIFSNVFEVPTNLESGYITSLILALIISPAKDLSGLMFLFWAAVLAMSSKYILVINKKHVFNPVAIAVVITAFVLGDSATWWVGNRVMLPFVLAGGFLVARKLRRSTMIAVFLAFSLLFVSIQKAIFDTPLIFFAFVMLTEPMTVPPKQNWALIYAVIAGLLFSPKVHLGSIYSTPELALVLANIFSFIVSPKTKAILTLKEKIQLSPDQWDFVFEADNRFSFVPGQYLELTLGHKYPDSRGNRRYFTLASSPTENDVRFGVKFYENASSFKKNLMAMNTGDKIVAGQLAGEFVLSEKPNRKYVFLAGGIGVTPYRSILKFLIDTNQKQDIVLIYSEKTDKEIIYKDIFSLAAKRIGLKVFYHFSETMGHLTGEQIIKKVPDFEDRYFYISGSHRVVTAMEKIVRKLGVPSSRIKTDFFPGFA